MRFAFICEGDTTTHGGRVIGCNTANTAYGKAIALLGDMVTCPRCGGIFPIVSVKSGLNMTFGDRPVATDGDKTACGATLIASQGTATVAPTAGQGSPIGGGKSVIAQARSAPNEPYRGRFQLLDDHTREPLANHAYTITSADDRTVHGQTDANGFTSWLDSDEVSSLTFTNSGASPA